MFSLAFDFTSANQFHCPCIALNLFTDLFLSQILHRLIKLSIKWLSVYNIVWILNRTACSRIPIWCSYQGVNRSQIYDAQSTVVKFVLSKIMSCKILAKFHGSRSLEFFVKPLWGPYFYCKAKKPLAEKLLVLPSCKVLNFIFHHSLRTEGSYLKSNYWLLCYSLSNKP